MNSNKFIQDNHKYWDWNGLKIFWSVVNESNKIPILLLQFVLDNSPPTNNKK